MNTHDTAPLSAPPSGPPRSVRKPSARGAGLRARALLLRALAAASVVSSVSAVSASAYAAAPSAAGIDLVVDGASWTLDPEAVRAAVGRELGGPVALSPAATAGRPTLVLRGETDGRVTLTYSSTDGRHIGRTIDLPEDPDRAAEAIALLAGNLVRDEAAELAAALGKRPPEEPAASPTPPAASPTPPVASPAPPAAVRSAKAAPPEPPPCALPGATTVRFGADVVPSVGSSSFTGTNVVRRYSLNLVGGYTAGVTGVELGAGVNISSAFMCGAQLSGGANLVLGPARGAQLTAGLNLAMSLRGAQVGPINVVTGPVDGVQGGVLNVAGPVDGVQGGAVNIAAGSVAGAQVGLANVAVGESTDVQVSLLNAAVSKSTDLQISLANVAAGESTGTQIGLVNVATGKVRGAQIGLVNYADESPFSLGLLNIVRNGRLDVDVWALESGIVMAGLKHGSEHFHNIYGVGVRLFGDRPLVTYALGLGGRITFGERAFLDLDALGYSLHDPSSSFEPGAVLAQARALLGLRLAPEFAIFGGPSYNVAFGDTPEDARLSPYGSIPLRLGDSDAQRAWPGVVLGVEVL
ncbi:LA_2272 family surface repeat-containing protein [Sorangium sp. So ce388]|uniref:LA_2272 family surface repeat-containing protein n=1 Tax=Sorangium sp. So ce388 TaxID=3133309 RepID=UPI003F5B520E